MRNLDKYTKDYNLPNFEDYQIIYRRKKILEIIKKYQPQSILEIGCGMDPLFQYLNDEYKTYYVVEPSDVFYENAVEMAKGKNVKCLHECFSPNSELKDVQFDFIICSGLLHELEYPQELINGIVEIANVDTTVIHINVPNAKSLHRLIAKEMGLIENEYEMSERNKLYQQHSVYDFNMLKKNVLDAGLQIIEAGTYFVKPFSHNQMYQMIKNQVIDEYVLEGLWGVAKYLPEYGSEIFVNCRLK